MHGMPISLGGGCDVATELLQRLALSDTTHFFDFLWNLDGGLANVTRIIQERFAGFDRPELYVERRHPEWNTPETPGQLRLACGDLFAEQLVHEKYPDVAFIHYRRGAALVEKFARKAERFLKLLEAGDPLTFVYYRQLHSPVLGRYHCGPDYAVGEKLTALREETDDFVRTLSRLYPALPFRIVSCFMELQPQPAMVTDTVERFFQGLKDSEEILYRRVLRRRSPASLESWDALSQDL